MKKLLYLTLLLVACHPDKRHGMYVHHTPGPFSTVDDTLILDDTILIKKRGIKKSRLAICRLKLTRFING